MTDVWFVAAGWGVILGGLSLYAVMLLRRLGRARATSERLGVAVDEGPSEAVE